MNARIKPAQLLVGALLGAGLLPACVNVTTQRWPGPMRQEVRPLPPGDSKLHPPGIEEVAVVRHADPVRIRPPGINSGRPLTFYDKQARLQAGSQVVVAPGGRAEAIWSEGSTVMFYGRAVAWLGSPSRGEPMLDLRDVERARCMLGDQDQVQLVGGSILYGPGGPFILTRDEDGTLAVHNQSKGSMRVAFRDEVFEMGPGQRLVLPLLSEGGRPFEEPEGLRRIPGPGFYMDLVGEVEPDVGDASISLRANGPAEVAAMGVRVRLAPGDRATFKDLARRSEEPELAIEPAPEPAPETLPAEPVPEPAPEGRDPDEGPPEEDSRGS